MSSDDASENMRENANSIIDELIENSKRAEKQNETMRANDACTRTSNPSRQTLQTHSTNS